MKEALSRTFLAHGIQVQDKLTVKGLKVWTAEGEDQSQVLLIRGRALGLPWSVIAAEFQQEGIQFRLIQLESVFLIANDTRESREFLAVLNQRATHERRFRIHVSGVGFARTRNRKSMDPRNLVLPALSVVGTLVFAYLFTASSQNRPQTTIAKTECAVELPPAEFLTWLEKSIESSPEFFSNTSTAIETDLGTIEIELRQSIGTTTFVRANVSCSDGVTQSYSFRTDSEAKGVFALLEELDSEVG